VHFVIQDGLLLSFHAKKAVGDLLMPKQMTERSESASESGFTLLEMLIAITIMALLAAVVTPRAFDTLTNAKTRIAQQEVGELGTYVERFALDVGRLPTDEEGLAALNKRPLDAENWQGPYIREGTGERDPWGHNWIYRQPSIRPGERHYDLCSPGPLGNGSEPGDGKTICNP